MLFDVFNHGIFVMVTLIVILPLILVFLSSFKTPEQIALGNHLSLPSPFTLENYKEVFEKGNILVGLKNSVIPKIAEKKTQEKIAVIKTETPLVLTLGIDGYVGEFGDITSGVVISREGNKLVMENSLNRKVVLDILINEKIKVWRDNITLKAGEKIVREFNEATKLVSISEAATEIEIDKISF